MSKNLDELERENNELRKLLREATFELCFPYCGLETEKKWKRSELCKDCFVRRFIDAC